MNCELWSPGGSFDFLSKIFSSNDVLFSSILLAVCGLVSRFCAILGSKDDFYVRGLEVGLAVLEKLNSLPFFEYKFMGVTLLSRIIYPLVFFMAELLSS